jgi:hypothetical protein
LSLRIANAGLRLVMSRIWPQSETCAILMRSGHGLKEAEAEDGEPITHLDTGGGDSIGYWANRGSAGNVRHGPDRNVAGGPNLTPDTPAPTRTTSKFYAASSESRGVAPTRYTGEPGVSAA